MRLRWWMLVLALAAHTAAAQQALVVSAASSLTNAFRDMGKAFEAAHPGTTVAFNFAASDSRDRRSAISVTSLTKSSRVRCLWTRSIE